MQDPSTPTPVDGIVAPASERAPETASPTPDLSPPKPQRAALNLTVPLFVAVGAIYVVLGVVFMSMFPRADGSLSTLKGGVTVVYGIGLITAVVFGVMGYLRITALKDRPRLRLTALIRLIAFTTPAVIVSLLVVFLINLPPKLRLNVVSPRSSAELIAPVSVTFGMDTALKYFADQKLTPLKFEWDYNNDGVMDQETFDPQSTYLATKAGIYNIVARVTMTSGAVKSVIYRLVVPRASFGVQPFYPIIEEPATFSLEHMFPKSADSSVPKLQKAKWDFDGDGNVDLESDKLTVSYTYHKLGSVNVAVSMTLTNQSQSSLQRTVQVVNPPEQPFPVTLETEPTTLLGPPPFGVLFTIKTKEPVANAAWDFGNGKTAEGLRVAQVFSSVGTMVVTATVRSQSGSIAKLSKVVRVTNPLEIRDLNFTGSPPVRDFSIEGEVPLIIDLTPNTIQPLITFSWDAPSATESEATDKSFHAVYRDQGKYYIDLIGIDPDQNVFRKRITVDAKPPSSLASFSMDPEAPIAPALVRFDASDTFVPAGQEITGFEWNFGDSSSQDRTKFSGARIEHQFDQPGTYVIELTVRTTAGQSFSGKRTLLVRAPLIDACFLPSRKNGKAPLGVRFDSACSTGDFTSWLWDFGDNAQSDMQSPTHVFLQPGEYTVTLTATTANNLKSTKSSVISVTAE